MPKLAAVSVEYYKRLWYHYQQDRYLEYMSYGISSPYPLTVAR